MNVLIVAPHPDDDAIGCGGTMCLHAEKGDRVVVVFLTSGELGLRNMTPEDAWKIREREAEDAGEILSVRRMDFFRFPDCQLDVQAVNVADSLSKLICQEQPEIIYLPHENDDHPDHQASARILRNAISIADCCAPTALSYEVWTPLVDYYHVENVTTMMSRKIRAIRCHKSQLAQLPYDRAATGINLYRGATVGGCRFAEIFQHVGLIG
jgi:N-acetylglucosamine malate deacetylase 1